MFHHLVVVAVGICVGWLVGLALFYAWLTRLDGWEDALVSN